MSPRARRAISTAVLLACAPLATVAAGSAAAMSRAEQVCATVRPNDVQAALGIGADKVNGPTSVRPGTCSWNSGDPTCTMRSLSIEVRHGPSAVAGYLSTRASTRWKTTVNGVGTDAFTSIEVLPPGAAVSISHLDARRGDTVLRVTLLGRLGPDGSPALLTRVARAVLPAS